MTGWVKAGLILGGAYGALLGVARVGYRSLLYPAPTVGLASEPAGARLRALTAADGVPVRALQFPSRGGRTVVYFHGNGDSIADLVDLGAAVAAEGLGFVAVEYRGYGSSRGKGIPGPSEQGLYQDAEAVLAALHDEGVTAGDLVLWGTSLGSGVAVEMALRGHGSRLVLFTPFTSIPAVAWRHLPVLPHGLLIGDRYDNLAKAPRVALPTLVVHGDADTIVPHDMGATLARAIRGAKLLTVPGADHNDLFIVGGRELLVRVLEHATK